MNERLLDATETMKRLGIADKVKLAEIAASGNLPYIQHSDSKNAKRLFPESGVEAYIASRIVTPAKDITEKLSQLAKGLEPRLNGREWYAPRNADLSDVYQKGKATLETIRREYGCELFWKKDLWEVICIIRKNLEALLDYAARFDDEVFTAELMKKLIVRNISLWNNIIIPHLGEVQDGLNEKLLATSMSANKGLWVRTKRPDHEMNVALGGECFRVGNEFQAIPAPVSLEDEKSLFNSRWHYEIKIDKKGEPVTFEERQKKDAAAQAEKKLAMQRLADDEI